MNLIEVLKSCYRKGVVKFPLGKGQMLTFCRHEPGREIMAADKVTSFQGGSNSDY